MILVVPERASRPELTGRRKPGQGAAGRKFAIDFRRWNIQVAVVISEHPPVLKFWNDLPLGEQTLREVGAEKFVGHDAIIGFPIRVRALQR